MKKDVDRYNELLEASNTMLDTENKYMIPIFHPYITVMLMAIKEL